MRRRRLLIAAAAALPAGVSGCSRLGLGRGGGGEAFGVSRSSPTAILWYSVDTIVFSIDMETEFRFRGGRPEIGVSDLTSFAESAIGTWS